MTQTFGKYRLVERLGGGGMAEVWRAEVSYSEDVSKSVALKMIREDMSSFDKLHSLFIDEARITSRISHANVAQVLDFGDVEGRPFLAMELVRGADLHTVMSAAGEQMRSIPLDVAAFVVAEVARGLHHAHQLADDDGRPYGVVHRDVSPQNVLLSYAGEVKVTDFGIARARDKATQTETGTVMGKFRYMSPEQVRGEELDARSDIFSCGILLYELVTGKQLFDGRTSAQVVDQIRYDDLPELSASRPEVDPALDTVLRWTLERDKNKRCPDGATLARDLERYVHVAHPQFTRDRVAELMESLLPRTRPAAPSESGPLAYAGTELAPATGPGRDGERPMKSLAELAREDAKAAADPETTAPAKRRASTPDRDADTVKMDTGAEAVPDQSMDGPSVPGVEYAEDLESSNPNATLTLAKRTGLSTSQPLPQASASHEAPTELIDDEDGTDHTRARPSKLLDAVADPGSQTATRTAGQAQGQAATRPRSGRRKPARRGRGVQATLGIVLALLLLGAVALLLLRKGEPERKPGKSPTASSMEPLGPGANSNNDATVDSDAAAAATDAGVGRLAELDQAITALKPEQHFSKKSSPAQLKLLLRLDQRLRYAVVDDGGKRAFGKPCGKVKPLEPANTDGEKLVDLYAERMLLDPKMPALISDAVHAQEASKATKSSSFARLSALRVMQARKTAKAIAFTLLIRNRGKQDAWCRPLAGKDGLRYLFPHLVVLRDALSRMLHFEPKEAAGRIWKRYLEARPKGQPAAVGDLTLTVRSSQKRLLKKDDNKIFMVRVQVTNTSVDQPVKLNPAAFQLHTAAPKPLVTGLWKPDLREPLAAGKTVVLELTFAAPMAFDDDTKVLSYPRPGAGKVWLRVSSETLQNVPE